MKITITKWEEYNYRKDVNAPRWFRFEHNFFENHEFYDFTHAEMVSWIYLLCLASKKNQGTILINKRHVEHIGRIRFKDFENAIKKLEEIQCITVDVTDTLRARYVADTSTGATLHNKTEHNITKHYLDGPDAPARRVFDFDSLYKKYPRKEGKQKGLAICKVQIKTDEDFNLLSKAIDQYTLHVQKNATEGKYIKHFSTFMNGWRDWVDPETGKAETFKKKKDYSFLDEV